MERTVTVLVVLCAAFTSTVLCDNVTTQIDENEMGMEVYFDIVKGFLGDVVQRKNISDSFLNLTTIIRNGKVDEDSLTDWKKWAEYLTGYAVCAGVGVLFVVVMPLAGLIFCCCRLCGKCGAKTKEYESRHGACKRRSYCTVLLILNTIMLGGAICGLVCVSLFQEHMQDDNGGTVAHMQSGLQEVDRFLDNSVSGLSDYVKGEFDSISTSVLNQVNESAENAVEEALDLLNATRLLNEAREVSKEAAAIKEDLDDAGDTLRQLQSDTEALSQELQDIQQTVDEVCTPPDDCPGYNADDYKVQSNFTDLKTLEDEAAKVAQSLEIGKYVDQAEKSINDAKVKATQSITEETDKANKAIQNVRKEIDEGLTSLNSQKDDMSKDLEDIKDSLGDANKHIKEYSDYVYYSGIGILCVMLLIIVLYYVGVLFGLCGERPGHGAPCCNTGTGSNFLMAGVAFTFLFTWLLMLVCTILFLLGGPAYTEVCRYFDGHEPKKFQVFDDALTNGLDISSFYNRTPPDLSIVKILQDCQQDEAIFSALNLDYIVDLNSLLNTQGLQDEIDSLKETTVDFDDVQIIDDQLKQELNNLAQSGLDGIEFQKYFDQLSKELTGAPLGTLAQILRGLTGNKTPEKKQKLEESATRLENLEKNNVTSISNRMVKLNNTMKDLQEKSHIEDSVTQLIKLMEKSESDFNKNKTALVKKEISKLADIINAETNKSIEDVKKEIRTNLARCSSLSNALYTVSDSVCILVLRPLNGFWFSLGWCLFFCIPCLIMAVLLASQYRREHKFVKEFEDPNYLMYGGPNPDTLPLTRIAEEQRYQGHGGPGPSGRGHAQHGYPYPGESNPGYSHDLQGHKVTPPPPYEDHTRYHRYQGELSGNA